MDALKDEVIDQASKHISEATTNAKSSVGESVNQKKTDVFSSVFNKINETVSASTNYLVQVEKMGNEKRAKELGISSRELKGLTTEEIASKYGMTVDQYQEKIKRDAKQVEQNNLANAAKEVKERAQIEQEAREQQAASLQMSMEEFNELTLQEQADKLKITLDHLLELRALDF